MIDSQGRVNLSTELCEKCNYTSAMKVWFVREDDMTYRLVPEEDVCGDMQLIASTQMDQKKRVFVPKAIREHYTNEALVYGKMDESYIYIRFFERANATGKETSLLIKKVEELIKLIAEKC